MSDFPASEPGRQREHFGTRGNISVLESRGGVIILATTMESLRQAKILVLDAEPLVRSVVTAILERHGYQVRTTESLQMALNEVKDFAPDLLLTNVYIPGTTGHDAARRLRELSPSMRVLMVAGLPDDRKVLSRTADDEKYDFFPKPFTARELAAKVREMLAR